MSLPSSWVDRIFDKLTVTYGHHFLGRWSGLDLDAVKADWAHELSSFQAKPEAIKHALQHLSPGDPPTVLQFREACNRCPERPQQALPLAKADPERVREAVASIRPIARRTEVGNKAWARNLRDRELHHGGVLITGRPMRAFHRTAWREVLGAEVAADASSPLASPLPAAPGEEGS